MSSPFKLSRIFKNLSIITFDRVLRGLVGLTIGVWMARYLGTESFGAYNYGIAVVAIFSSVATFGLESLMIRDLVVDSSRAKNLLGSAIMIRLALSLCSVVLCYLGVALGFLDTGLGSSFVIIISISLLFQPFDSLENWFQSFQKPHIPILAKMIPSLLISAVRVYFIVSARAPEDFAWLLVFEAFLGACALIFVFLRSKNGLQQLYLGVSTVRYLLKEGWPLALTTITVILYMRTDQVMLGQMVGEKSVGIYSAGLRWLEVWYFIPMMISTIALPECVRARARGIDAYQSFIRKYFRGMTWGGIILSVFLFATAAPLIRWTFGEEYLGAVSVLQINAWALVFVFQGIGRSSWMIAENQQKLAALFTALGLITNILLNLILIPQMEAKGAALATTVTQGLTVLVFPLFFRATRPCARALFSSFRIATKF